MTAPTPSQAGVVSHSAQEIARVLQRLMARHTPVTAYAPGVLFQSLLRRVDARAGRILLERSPDETANAALLARPRCTFHSDIPDWHIEFVTAGLRATVDDGTRAIQCVFPEVLATYQRRTRPRIDVKPPLLLRVLADAAGITPFDARVVDIAVGGISFLLYSQAITLEPGTLLRGCRIELPNGSVCVADLEVRYTEAVSFADGRRAMRSGCRFASPSPEVTALAQRYVGKS